MGYYDFKGFFVVLPEYTWVLDSLYDDGVKINFSCYNYATVSADKISTECKNFEDSCRRYLYGISPIKMGFTENKELDMIRTEMKVLILRVLQRDRYATFGLRAEEHIVETIDLKKFVDMHKVDLTEYMSPHKIEGYIENLRRRLLEEIGVPENSGCDCYMVENRETIFHVESKIEKFFFFHNASQRRIFTVAYRVRRTGLSITSESEGESETKNENETEKESETENEEESETETEEDDVMEEGDASRRNSEVGDEDPEIADEIEEERVHSIATDSEGGDGSEDRSSRLPVLGDCDLYYVKRSTFWFCNTGHKLLVQQMMDLPVVFQDENSPSDSILVNDDPDDHLFVLIGPVKAELKILSIIQISLEGQISKKSAFQLFRNKLLWNYSEEFAGRVLPRLSGARIVRIATQTSAMRLGYDSAAVELLTRYFEGQLAQLSEVETEDAPQVNVTEAAQKFYLVDENMTPRADLPPFLVKLCERRPESLHYLCASFGLTLDLICFWKKQKFAALFIGHALNSVTGEYPCMVLKPLKCNDFEAVGSDEWGFYGPFYRGFKRMLVELFSCTYRKMNYKLAMGVLDPKINFIKQDPASASSEMKFVLEPEDMKRLEAYSNNLIDYTLILDVAIKLARMYFLEELPVSLSDVQASVLFCYCLQGKDIPDIEIEMSLKRERILDYYLEVMQKFYEYLKEGTPEEDNCMSY